METSTVHTIEIDVRTEQLIIEQRAREHSEYQIAEVSAWPLATIPLAGIENNPSAIIECLLQAAALVRTYAASREQFASIRGVDDDLTYLAFVQANGDRIAAEIGAGFLGRYITVAASGEPTT